MAYSVGSLVGTKDFLMDFYASAALVAGQLVVREATASNIGEATNPSSTSSATNVLGVVIDPASSQTSPTKEPGTLLFATTGLENLVRIDVNPFAILRFQASGSSTNGAALTTLNVLTISTADTSAPFATLTAGASISTVNMSGGLVKGRTGNNAGSVRKLISQVDSVSVTVGIGFVNSILVGDTFIRVPWGRSAIAAQMTSDFVQMDASIAFGTGASFRVVNVIIDEQNNLAYVDVIAVLQYFNKNS